MLMVLHAGGLFGRWMCFWEEMNVLSSGMQLTMLLKELDPVTGGIGVPDGVWLSSYTHACSHTRIHTHAHTCLHIECLHLCTQIHTQGTSMHANIQTHAYTRTQIYTQTHTHAYPQRRTHTVAHAHAHIRRANQGKKHSYCVMLEGLPAKAVNLALSDRLPQRSLIGCVGRPRQLH